MRLVMRKCEWIDDWYVIERAEHDGSQWFEQTAPGCMSLRCSSRFSDADVEGPSCEMLAIAKAIRDRSVVSFRRCEVDATGDEVKFCSPRNSTVDGVVNYAEALELAELIEREDYGVRVP